AITTDAWRNSLDHYQEFVIIVALDLKIEERIFIKYICLCLFFSPSGDLLLNPYISGVAAN
ncbi:hypothetical protein, partial [Lacticaseibacillus paracasei]|uniref:hypothetical protein n=1 Tax=Lacticaseibacillus paracasei TaxID=1597 RepID=UPI0040460374